MIHANASYTKFSRHCLLFLRSCKNSNHGLLNVYVTTVLLDDALDGAVLTSHKDEGVNEKVNVKVNEKVNVNKNMKILKEKGYITRIGSDKRGTWDVKFPYPPCQFLES